MFFFVCLFFTINENLGIQLYDKCDADMVNAFLQSISLAKWRAPVAQWVKGWPTDLAVQGSSPAQGRIFSFVNRVLLHTAFQYHLLTIPIWLLLLFMKTQSKNYFKTETILNF